MDKYINVLENDETNAFASLGVANILAEHGKINEAMEVYKVLKETNPNIPHPLLNQAHLNMAQESYETAANLYQKALEKFPGGRDLETELYLAKVHFKLKAYDSCKKILMNLMVRYPHDLRLKFDLSLCLLE